jgi:hypothetical protein
MKSDNAEAYSHHASSLMKADNEVNGHVQTLIVYCTKKCMTVQQKII